MVKKEKCENCGHELEIITRKPQQISVDSPEINPTIATPQTQMLVPPAPEPPKEKKLTHEQITDLMPKGTNFMSCPGGDCGHMKLKNKNQTLKFKECPNCESNTVPKGSEICPTCGKNLDQEDLEDGVELGTEEDE